MAILKAKNLEKSIQQSENHFIKHFGEKIKVTNTK